jgi:hypothetical protein
LTLILGPLLWRLLPWGLLAAAGLVGWALWNRLGMAKLKLANAQEVIRSARMMPSVAPRP